MIYKFIIGVDISKLKLDIALRLDSTNFVMRECLNEEKQISKNFKTLLKEHRLKKEDVLIVAENTGNYTNPMTWALVEEGYNLWIACPNQAHYSLGLIRGKNDKLDAKRLADYGFRNDDKAKLCELASESLVSLKYLNSEKELITKQKSMLKGQLTDHKQYVDTLDYKDRSKRHNKTLKVLEVNLKAIDKRISEIIKNDPQLKHQMKLLNSIVGVGPKIALEVLIATLGFRKFPSAREFSSHVGVAPFEYQSGSSIRSKGKTSKRSNRRIKRYLHMGVCSAVHHGKGEFTKYYERKIKEGKEKMLVLNNLRSKLIHIMFAVIRNNTAYQRDYKALWT
ncbi:IS110 family transposase [Flammeovirga sp. OC4]|uniref:IS110 family transposase n=1 Tax=Flammeovirga sp. OC4 TaxID=1382345 RepID=UPI0005C76A7D|nr:IS110 family transposase [Flammeovirga sp. OC4]